MNMETLVEEIAREVYARLYKLQEANEEGKKRAVILSEDKDESLESMLREQYSIRYYEPQMRNCDLVIVPQMCIKLLANLANGLANEAAERFIMTMLLKGRKVIILEEGILYRKFKKVAPPAVYKLYEAYEDKLKSFGVMIVPRDNVLQACKPGYVSTKTAEPSQKETEPQLVRQAEEAGYTSICHKKLITEADIRKLYMKNMCEIVIGPKSILTPLARDFIRTQRIQVRRA